MSYYRQNDEAVDDFDEFDPTPYGGGFDLALTYGRPLEPSEEICYPISTTCSSGMDYERPHYAPDSEAIAYGDEALNTEYSSYSRYNEDPSRFGSGYQEEPPRRPDYQQHDYERPKPTYGRPSYEEEEYRKPSYEQPEEEEYRKPAAYGRTSEEEEYRKPSGYGRPSYEQPQEEEYSGYEQPQEEEYRKPSAAYGRTSYGQTEEEEYRKPSYGREDSEYDQSSYQQRTYAEESRPKYGDNSDDEDEEKKKHRHGHHHRRKNSDD